jgi:TolB-like protein/Tfp pilus assembly protein PilF
VISSDLESFACAVEENDQAKAVSFYSAPFLDGFYLNGGGEFETWAEAERTRWASQYRSALEGLCRDATGHGDDRTAAIWWRRLLELDPLSSHAALGLMNALEHAGEHAEALRCGEAHVQLVRSELGDDPSQQVSEWMEQHRHISNGVRASNTSPAMETEIVEGDRAPTEVEAAPGKLVRRVRRAQILSLTAVAAVLLLLTTAGYTAWRQRTIGVEPVAGRKLLAVLPFENLGAADKAYFADGITDEIRGKLATVPGLRVTARTSSAQYRHTTKSPKEIGLELGVDYLLTGTVRWDQDGERSRVRVVPELVQASSGATRWQQSFDAPLTDVFHMQADVAQRVANELGIALVATGNGHLSERAPGDLRAYDLYLRGRYAWHRRTATELEQARRLMEQAIALDPAFAPAHAALADIYTVLPLWSDLPPHPSYSRAKAAAMEALRLDSSLATPYAALADINALYDWDWASAELNFRRSLALDPNNANTRHWYGEDYLMTVGRTSDALAQARRARELDPLSAVISGNLGRALYRAGRLEESAAQLRDVLALDPAFVVANNDLGRVYLSQGRTAEALPLLERGVDSAVRYSADIAMLALGYAQSGSRKRAEALMDELLSRRSKGYVAPSSIAVVAAALGDTLEAFAWLDQALEVRDPQMLYLFVNEPLLEPFKRKSRGEAVLRAMGLSADPTAR